MRCSRRSWAAGRSPASRRSIRGKPVSRISESTNGFLRGRPGRNIVGGPGRRQSDRESVLVQPQRLRAGGRRHLRQLGALRMAAAGGAIRPTCRLSKNWDVQRHAGACSSAADAINAFQPHASGWADPNVAGLDNTCTVSLTTCNPSNDTFGQILATPRAAREFSSGSSFYW